MKTLRDLNWLLTAGKPTPSCKAATLLCLHGVRASISIRLKAGDVTFATRPAAIMVDGIPRAYVTNELSDILGTAAKGKPPDGSLLGYHDLQEFYRDFRQMGRTAKLHTFSLEDLKEILKAAAGSDYPLLKQYESAQPFTPDDVKRAWLKVLPRLVVGV